MYQRPSCIEFPEELNQGQTKAAVIVGVQFRVQTDKPYELLAYHAAFACLFTTHPVEDLCLPIVNNRPQGTRTATRTCNAGEPPRTACLLDSPPYPFPMRLLAARISRNEVLRSLPTTQACMCSAILHITSKPTAAKLFNCCQLRLFLGLIRRGELEPGFATRLPEKQVTRV